MADLGWASRGRGRGEAEDGGSALTDGSGGDHCDDEDGCGASGEESGESHVQTNMQKRGINNGKHTPTQEHADVVQIHFLFMHHSNTVYSHILT